MTAKEIINIGPGGVRNNSTYMTEYERLFKEQFGYKPECPTCGSVRDWNIFKAFANGEAFTKPQIIMSNKTFELINNSIIYSYDYEDKKLNRLTRKRVYGNLMTEQFAEEYLTIGTEEQILLRKKQFRLLPDKFRVDTQNDPEKLAELKSLATQKGYPEEEFKDISGEADMAAYLDAKALEDAELKAKEEETKKLQQEAEERMRKEREEKEAEQQRLEALEAERAQKEAAEKAAKEEEERIAKEKSDAEANAKAETAAKSKDGKVK